MQAKHRGSNFDDFLKEEELLNQVEATAIKRVLAYQIKQAMIKKHLTKTAMAQKMRTSRSELDRLLDPENISVTLKILIKAANTIDRKIKISFVK